MCTSVRVLLTAYLNILCEIPISISLEDGVSACTESPITVKPFR